MNNLLSYCGLVDPRISASDKDLPVLTQFLVKVLVKAGWAALIGWKGMQDQKYFHFPQFLHPEIK